MSPDVQAAGGPHPTDSSAGLVASVIERRILDGQLAPGAALREVVLAADLGVSRNTLREGLRLLVFRGLVQHVQNRGAHVVRVGPDDAREIYQVRRVLELAAVELTAARRPADSRALGVALTELERAAAAHDPRLLVEADLAFHRSLVEMLGSSRLSAFFRTMESQLLLAFSIVSARDREFVQPQGLVDEHKALFDAIARGEVEAARRLLGAHLDHYEARCVLILGGSENAGMSGPVTGSERA